MVNSTQFKKKKKKKNTRKGIYRTLLIKKNRVHKIDGTKLIL